LLRFEVYEEQPFVLIVVNAVVNAVDAVISWHFACLVGEGRGFDERFLFLPRWTANWAGEILAGERERKRRWLFILSLLRKVKWQSTYS
jgi:hypothetical protein